MNVVYLQQHDGNNIVGLTLPASAVGLLSSQIYPNTNEDDFDDDDCAAAAVIIIITK